MTDDVKIYFTFNYFSFLFHYFIISLFLFISPFFLFCGATVINDISVLSFQLHKKNEHKKVHTVKEVHPQAQ